MPAGHDGPRTMVDVNTGLSPLAVLGLGFVLGLRHALDLDHFVAVSTIVSERRGIWRSSLVGVAWGIGHTTALVAVTVVAIGFHARIPPLASRLLELGVAIMLVGLGARLLHAVVRGDTLHAHVHEHAGLAHAHLHRHPPGAAAHDHARAHRRPFLVGLVHGLAGSGTVVLAVAATIEDPAIAVACVVVFGLGSIAGMAVTSAVFAIPSRITAGRVAAADRWLRATAALASVAVGIGLAVELGREVGLFA